MWSDQACTSLSAQRIVSKADLQVDWWLWAWGITQVTVTNALGFLLFSLYLSFAIRLNKQIGWLTPGCLLSLVVFCSNSIASPWDLPGGLQRAAPQWYLAP